MKKQVKLLMAAFLSLSILIPVTGCEKAGSVTNKTHDTNAYESVTYQTLNTNAYELVVPTGTRVESDEPDLPAFRLPGHPPRNESFRPEKRIAFRTDSRSAPGDGRCLSW